MLNSSQSPGSLEWVPAFAFGHLLKAVLYLLPPVPFKYLLSTLESSGGCQVAYRGAHARVCGGIAGRPECPESYLIYYS